MRGAAGAVGCCLLALSAQAQAHGFGERYDLPIPLSLYLTGAGFTVAVSFAMMGFFLRLAQIGRAHV